MDVETPEGWVTGSMVRPHAVPVLGSLSKRDLRRDLRVAAIDLARTERALTKALQADLERRWSMAAAGHDLRQPLQIMLLALDSLGRRPDRGPWMADVLHGEIERLRQGLDQLAVDARTAPEAMAPTSLVATPVADLFAAMRAHWSPVALAKGLELKIVASNLAVMSDPAMLCAIADNLVGNAIKYTARGRVLIGCRRAGSQVRIEVIDTGAGFDPADLPHLAQPFCQGDTASDGLGLGLSLVSRAVQRLGHRLSVRSGVGQGACFAVTAPRA